MQQGAPSGIPLLSLPSCYLDQINDSSQGQESDQSRRTPDKSGADDRTSSERYRGIARTTADWRKWREFGNSQCSFSEIS